MPLSIISVNTTPMSASDCYELGRALLYKKTDVFYGCVWMHEALRKYYEEIKNETVTCPITEIEIIENICLGYHMLGDVRKALHWTQILLDLDPTHSKAKENIIQYQKNITQERTGLKKDTVGLDTKKGLSELERYQVLCRGYMDVAPAISNRLTCRYLTETHPFLKIAPIKMEMMYINPDIVMFHNVISNREIEIIKSMSRFRFQRATIGWPANSPDLTKYRISKVSWLYDSESEITTRLTQRVNHMTGFSTESAEALQVVNYGIGGYYTPHNDFPLKYENVTMRGGNRLATVLFYMSDVSLGGATVFTELGLTVFPVKGAAVYWINLYPSGEGDLATHHAACPVVLGSKWICNKWLHEYGQEFIRPCNLKYQKEGIDHLIIPPVPKCRNSEGQCNRL